MTSTEEEEWGVGVLSRSTALQKMQQEQTFLETQCLQCDDVFDLYIQVRLHLR